MSSRPSFLRRHWPVLTVLTVALVAFLAPIRHGGLAGDAPTYAWMGRRMLATGDYLRLYYDWAGRFPYFFKPPGQFWLSTLAYRAFGYTVAAARLAPSLLWISCALALYAVMRLQHPRRVAATAAVALCVQRELVMNAMEVRLDAGMVLAQLLATYAAARLLIEPREPRGRLRWFALIGGACGVGLMTRGFPTLLCLPVLLAAFAWGGRVDVLRSVRGWAVAVGVGVAVAGPWYGYQLSVWGDAFAGGLADNAFGRNLAPESLGYASILFYYARRIPESYWLTILPAAVGAVVLVARGRRGRKLGAIDRLAVAWVVVYFLLIHLSTQRNIRYAIPLFPWLGVLAAVGAFSIRPIARAWRKALPFVGPVAVVIGGAIIAFGLPLMRDRDAPLRRLASLPPRPAVYLAAAPGVDAEELNWQKRCAIQFYTGARSEVIEFSTIEDLPPGEVAAVFLGDADAAATMRAASEFSLIDRNRRWLIYRTE